jgi:hypothetical protein
MSTSEISDNSSICKVLMKAAIFFAAFGAANSAIETIAAVVIGDYHLALAWSMASGWAAVSAFLLCRADDV